MNKKKFVSNVFTCKNPPNTEIRSKDDKVPPINVKSCFVLNVYSVRPATIIVVNKRA